MKKLILFITVLTLSISGFAQDITGGVKVGLSGSSIIAPVGKESNEIGILIPTFHGGLYGRLQIAHFFRFQLEALYSQRGGSFDNLNGKLIGTTSYNIEYTDKLNYLDIPLVFMLHGGITSFQIGLQPSFLLSQSTETSGTITDLNGNEIKLEDQFGGDLENFRTYSKNDFSVLFGFQFDLPVGVNVGFRVLYSLGNIYDIDRAKVGQYIDPARL